jgi:putative tryptophan/tyrosine transport system substrate-binding protein
VRRREFISASALVLFARAGLAQGVRKIVRLGYLSPAASRTPADAAFEDALRGHGWIADQNIRIDYRYSAGQQDSTAALADEIIGLDPDVIVVWGPAFALAAKQATTRIPIVFFILTDPVAWGLVRSYAHPEGNITGITTFASNEIISKFLELSKEVVPSLTRLAVLFSTEQTVNSEHKAAMAAAARSLRIELDEIEVGVLSDLANAIRRVKERGAEALFVWPTGFAFSFAKQISDVALTNRLPSVHPYTEGARAGGLLGYGPDFTEEARRGAAYVDKILGGDQPSSLPVEQISKYALVLNLNTAKALGLAIPPSLLVRADSVVE